MCNPPTIRSMTGFETSVMGRVPIARCRYDVHWRIGRAWGRWELRVGTVGARRMRAQARPKELGLGPVGEVKWQRWVSRGIALAGALRPFVPRTPSIPFPSCWSGVLLVAAARRRLPPPGEGYLAGPLSSVSVSNTSRRYRRAGIVATRSLYFDDRRAAPFVYTLSLYLVILRTPSLSPHPQHQVQP